MGKIDPQLFQTVQPLVASAVVVHKSRKCPSLGNKTVIEKDCIWAWLWKTGGVGLGGKMEINTTGTLDNRD